MPSSFSVADASSSKLKPNFEFVEDGPLPADKKVRTRTKVRSNARKWQILQQRKAAYDVEKSVKENAVAVPVQDDVVLALAPEETLNFNWTSGEYLIDSSFFINDGFDVTSPSNTDDESHFEASRGISCTSSRTSTESPSEMSDSTWGWSNNTFVPRKDLINTGWNDQSVGLGARNVIRWPQSEWIPNPVFANEEFDAQEKGRAQSSTGILTLLGAGKYDPFGTYPSKLPGALVGRYIDVLVRGPLRNATGGRNALRAPTAFVQKAISSPMLFHTLMFSAGCYNLAIQGIPIRESQARDVIYSEGEAIRHINNQISNPKTACTDETIHAVLYLANIGMDPSARRGNFRAPRQGPLRELQCLNVYGTYEMRAAHRQGLVTLLKMRGGLDTFGPNRLLPGLISYVDIMSAVVLGSKPTLPYVSLTKGVDKTHLNLPAGWFSQARFALCRSVESFRGIFSQGHWSTSELLDIIEHMSRFTLVIDKHHDKLAMLDLPLMADHRNLVQYRLMMLPTPADLNLAGVVVDELYDVCRLGAMIYCLIVVFPYPASRAPFRRLAVDLLASMAKVVAKLDSMPELSLWLLFMGGIAAVGDPPERALCVHFLRKPLSALQLHTWNESREILEAFLWYDRVSDSDGRELFHEAKRPRSISGQPVTDAGSSLRYQRRTSELSESA